MSMLISVPLLRSLLTFTGPSWMGNTRLGSESLGSDSGWLIKNEWKKYEKMIDFPVCVSEHLEQFLAVFVQMCSGCGEANQ